jgi:hypothetical protein
MFCTNIIKILELNDSTLIDQNLRFKNDYLQTMYDESSAIKAFYTPIMQSRKVEITYWKEAKKNIFRKILDVRIKSFSSSSLYLSLLS